MGLPVTSHESRAVHRDHDRKVLKTDVMERLVIRPLKKR